MKVIEFLDDYISENPFKQASLCTKLKRELNEGAVNNSGWSFFIYMLESKKFGQNLSLSILDPLYHPFNISLLCKSLFKTDEVNNLLNFLDSFEQNGVKTESLLDVLMSRIHINITDFPEIEYNFLNQLIFKQCDTEKYIDLKKNDSKYHVIPRIHLQPIIDACPYDTNTYIKDSFDCEDFALSTKTWLSQQGLGNATLFYAVINAYNEKENGDLEFDFAHGINLIVVINQNSEYECLYLEPQKDKIWKPKDKMSWGWENKVTKLRFLMQ